ncbi:MAG: alkaline phosphatase family protein, partial [Sphingobacteriales bacterium]
NTIYPIDTYVQSSADNSPKYEGKFEGAETPTLPVKTSQWEKSKWGKIKSTPYGNTLTLDMAKAAIDNEQLGNGAVTDFLAVSLSSTDYVGHQFGPNAVEVEDMYLRLDKDLAAFFTYLDGKVGKGAYTVFLTADHAVAHNPAFLTDNKIPAGVWKDPAKQLNSYLEEKFKQKNIIHSIGQYQVNLNYKVIGEAKLDEEAIKSESIKFLEKQPDIALAVDMRKAQTTSIPHDLRERIINGYNIERSGVIQIILKPGYFQGGSTGTTHGTWNPYDAHIPLVFMGWGVKHGNLTRETHMTDIAPTVAALLHIQAPNGNIGKTISEVLK